MSQKIKRGNAKRKKYNHIPVKLKEIEFNEFILPHITKGNRGPDKKIPLYKIFNYILNLIYTGKQWKELKIELDKDGNPEIHYSNVFRSFKKWVKDGCFRKIFVGSVYKLFISKMLDLDVIHGDGTTTTAKKGAII